MSDLETNCPKWISIVNISSWKYLIFVKNLYYSKMKKHLLLLGVFAASMASTAQTLIERYKLDFASSKGENGTTGLYAGWATTDRGNQANGAVNFNGSNHLSLGNPTINATNGFTISFWYYPSSTMTGTSNHFVMSKRAVCTSGNQLNIIATPSTNTLSINLRKDSPAPAFTANTSVTTTMDTWQLITFVVDNTNHRVLGYVNNTLGAFSAYSNTTSSIVDFATTTDLVLGSSPCVNADGSVKFKGKLDEVRLYASTLTATQVGAIYSETTTTPVATAVSASNLLVYEDKMDMNCSNNPKNTAVGASATTNRGNDANSATLFNGTSSVSPTHDRMLINPLSELQKNYSNLTISAWVKRTISDNNSFIVSNYYGTNACGNNTNQNGMVFRIFNGKINFFTTEGIQNASISGSTTLGLNTWYQVAVRLKQPITAASDIELFVNGVKETPTIDQFTMTNLPQFIPTTNANLTSIGGSITSVNTVCNTDQSMAGAIDDLKIYKGLLSDNEILSLSTEAASAKTVTSDVTSSLTLEEPFTFTDSTSFATKYNGSYSGISFAPDHFGNARSAMRFSGANAYINAGINISTTVADGDPFSYSVWINPEDLMSNNMILGHAGDGGCENQRQQYFRILDGKVDFTAVFNLVANSAYRSVTGNTLLSPGTWYHVVVNVNQPITSANDIQIYLNGVRETVTITSNGTGSLPVNTSKLGFGNYLRTTGTPCNLSTDASFKGIIDNIKIFDKFLCEEDISALYNEANPILTSANDLLVNSDNNIVVVYPNPATQTLTVQNYSNTKFAISDQLGRTVLQGQSNNGSIDVSTLEKGIYYVKLEDNRIAKFVKE